MPTSLWMMQHGPPLFFVFCVGACVGSFLNVVLYRLPLGMSVTHPSSRCSVCGRPLSFFRENLPILGWFMVRGTCRTCGTRVSAQYMIVELLTALGFVGLYALLYLVPNGDGWLAEISGAWWRANTHSNPFLLTAPAFFTVALMLTALVAMTVIDARTFTIPIEIPLFITIFAFIAWPLQYAIGPRAPAAMTWPIHCPDGMWALASVGGLIAWAPTYVLLRIGVIPYSFDDYHKYVKDGETLGEYPHGRREMGKELRFIAPIVVGMVLGGIAGVLLLGDAAPPRWLQATTAPILGYFSGAAVIWAIRILGTYAFGREAMGMGDVHLMGAVGAVLGWFDPIIIFFLAPFSGIAWALTTVVLPKRLASMARHLPFGPHLAVGTLALLLLRPILIDGWHGYAGVRETKNGLEPASLVVPARGFVETPAETAPE